MKKKKRIMWVKACKNNEANIENETKEKNKKKKV